MEVGHTGGEPGFSREFSVNLAGHDGLGKGEREVQGVYV